MTAPMSGTVTAVGVETGDNYQGEEMFEISDCSNLQVSTTVSEYDIAKVKKGQKVVILTDATDDTELQGTISMNDKNENLRVGMTAKCSIILEEAEDVYAVPYDAIHTNSNGDTVLYVQDGTSQKEVSVTKGMESDYYVEVSGDELSENLQVIIPSDKTSQSSDTETTDSALSGMFGAGSGGKSARSGSGMGGMGGSPGGMPRM